MILLLILFIYIRYERSGDEDSCSLDKDCETAVEDLRNLCLEDFVVVERLLNSLVPLLGSETLVRKDNLSFAVIYLENFDFQLIACSKLGCQIDVFIAVFILCKDAVRLVTDVEVGNIRFHVEHSAFNDLSISDSLEALVEHLFKTLFL